MRLLLSPLAWLLAALALAVLAHRLPQAAWWRGLAGLVALGSLLASTPLAANKLIGLLEDDAAAQPCPAVPATVVVLAGGIELRPVDESDFGALNGASRRRMDRAIALWRERPDTILVLSGGDSARHSPPISRLMAAQARAGGVPDRAIRIEAQSLDTWQSAEALATMLPKEETVGLVTSAAHLTRARIAFSAHGLRTCGLPADFRRMPVGLPWGLIPRLGALEKTEQALHEWVGRAWYRWRARQRA